jgi:peptide deformylase
MMAKILPILKFPDERLRQKALPVQDFGENFQGFIDDLFETLYEEGNGIGLAATQVNVQKQVVVIDMTGSARKQPFCLINPEFIEVSEQTCKEIEGCLSVPGACSMVKRPKSIKVKYQDRHGTWCELEDDTYFARCIQHEADHLNGVLFIDHLSLLKRRRIIETIKKMRAL